MKKLFTFLAGAALLGSLSACSSDEPTKGPDGPDITTGDAAYLAVRIIGADGLSRSVTDGNYEFGEGRENEVDNAKFFFFDKDGNYVLEAKVVDDPKTTQGNKNENSNIELKVKTVLVLDGLTDKGAAAYMLTILNASDFTAESTLEKTLAKTTNWAKTIGENTEPHFVMSTSSYLCNDLSDKHHNDVYYYATKLDENDYKDTAEDAQKDANTVDIYVERLAAKIDFDINISDDTKKKENVTVKDGKDEAGNDKTITTTIYQLTQTVGGGPNEGNPVATSPLYIAVLDWNIGGITNDSYMFKNIKRDWDFTDWASNTANVTWNDATRFRSYWAQSTVYNKDVINVTPSLLSYANSKNLVGTNNARYCNENTNIPEKIFIRNGATPGLTETTTAVNPELVTHATIRAKICDENGNALNMVMANGVLFKQDEYIKRILSRYTLDHTIEILVKDAENSTADKTVYKEIDETYFTYVPEKETGNEVGQTIFKFDDTKKTGKFYQKSTAETGPDHVDLEGDELNKKITALNEALLAEQKEYVGNDKYATIYDNGNFVYYVPIEHLGAAAGQKVAVEGYYGVVRNHWYRLTIDEFTKVGHGIWDPNNYDETYIPKGPQEYFYLGARINILSWKIVNQSVKL